MCARHTRSYLPLCEHVRVSHIANENDNNRSAGRATFFCSFLPLFFNSNEKQTFIKIYSRHFFLLRRRFCGFSSSLVSVRCFRSFFAAAFFSIVDGENMEGKNRGSTRDRGKKENEIARNGSETLPFSLASDAISTETRNMYYCVCGCKRRTICTKYGRFSAALLIPSAAFCAFF